MDIGTVSMLHNVRDSKFAIQQRALELSHILNTGDNNSDFVDNGLLPHDEE